MKNYFLFQSLHTGHLKYIMINSYFFWIRYNRNFTLEKPNTNYLEPVTSNEKMKLVTVPSKLNKFDSKYKQLGLL